jgi:Ca2+/Na+ antiporter
MGSNLYEKYFSENELYNLKPSEVRKLKEGEAVLSIVVVLMMLFVFASFMTLVGIALWFTKITIFLCILTIVPTIVFYTFYNKLAKEYKKTIESYKEQILVRNKNTHYNEED